MKSIKSVIEQIIIENDMEDEVRFVHISDIWKNHFFKYADNIVLLKYKNKVLYLKTDFPAWRQEIIMRLDTIIEQLNFHLKEKLIEKITI